MASICHSASSGKKGEYYHSLTDSLLPLFCPFIDRKVVKAAKGKMLQGEYSCPYFVPFAQSSKTKTFNYALWWSWSVWLFSMSLAWRNCKIAPGIFVGHLESHRYFARIVHFVLFHKEVKGPELEPFVDNSKLVSDKNTIVTTGSQSLGCWRKTHQGISTHAHKMTLASIPHPGKVSRKSMEKNCLRSTTK